MMNLGPMELMILLFASPGQGSDLAHMIEIKSYFESRNLPMTIEKKIELAQADPKTAVAQTRQLLALRWFGENTKAVMKSDKKAEIMKSLKDIASGKTANDRLGFAKEYANNALLRLQGKKIPVVRKADSIRKDSMRWFPASANLIGALDLRAIADSDLADKKFKNPLFAFVPANDKKRMFDQFFEMADELGNVRIERISFAYAEDLQNQQQSRICVRVTGKVHLRRFVDWLRNKAPNRVVAQMRNDFQGNPITSLQFGNDPPALALVGDTDLVAAGTQGNRGNHPQVVAEALDVRAGRQGSVVTGAMNKYLNKISKSASGMLIGNVPMTMRQAFGRATPMPYFVTMELKPKGNNQVLAFEGQMNNAADAMAFKKTILQGRDDVLKKLQNAPPGMPAQFLDVLRKMLKSVKIEAKENTVSGSVLFDPKVLMSFGMYGFTARNPGIQMPMIFMMRRVR